MKVLDSRNPNAIPKAHQHTYEGLAAAYAVEVWSKSPEDHIPAEIYIVFFDDGYSILCPYKSGEAYLIGHWKTMRGPRKWLARFAPASRWLGYKEAMA